MAEKLVNQAGVAMAPAPGLWRRWLAALPARLWLLTRWLFSLLPYFYFLRIVILAGFVMVVLAVAAFFTSAKALLYGLFDLDAPQIFVVTFAAFLTTWGLLVIGRLIVINGCERFDVPFYVRPEQLDRPDTEQAIRLLRARRPGFWTVLLCSLLAVPIIVGTFVVSTSAISWKLLAIVLGFIAALVVLEIVLLFYYILLSPRQRRESPGILHPYLGPRQQRINTWATKLRWPRRLRRLLWPLMRAAPENLGRGFFHYNARTNRADMLYPGHLLAFLMLVAVIVVYVGIWIWKGARLGTAIPVPALAYALVLLMVLSWALAALTFFCDRYRFPLLIVLLLWGAITAQLAASDYTYPVIQQPNRLAVPTGAVLDAADNGTMIVVAANGGGIQSAAWTAQVLAGLELQARQEFGPQFRKFGSSVRLISSVSGGSTGAMYFSNAYSPAGLPDNPEDVQRIVEQAMTSSLDDLAYGVVYPDLVRAVLPNPLITNDRGRALERAWMRIGGLEDGSTTDFKLSEGLDSWREGVSQGWRPVNVFNATIADTGERLLFSTVDFPATQARRRMFDSAYQKYDLPIATAARLSASFPYVSPAARIDSDDPTIERFHIVDGGYYDNYGMATLSEWLDAALSQDQERSTPGQIKKVLVIEIRGSLGDTDKQQIFTPDATCPREESRSAFEITSSRGWFYQAFAPLSTLLNVRDTGQGEHNKVEFDLLKRTWATRGVDISSVTFQYRGPDTPLSWHLTEEQQTNIRRHWAALMTCGEHKEWNAVKSFLEELK